MNFKQIITKNVLVLSLISFFTDVASEMLYPIMPIYLKSIGFSVVLIGVLEGIADATAGYSKGYFGSLSDNIGKRLPFIQIGYLLSGLSRPLIIVSNFPLWVFGARTMDKLGKGVRTAARDALLSDETTVENKSTVFGFHRGIDTMGAVVGPLIALLYLAFYPEQYQTLFLICAIPSLLAVISTFLIKEKKVQITPKLQSSKKYFEFIKYWKKSPIQYRKLCTILLLFILFHSSDVFLLLKIKETTNDDAVVIGAYIFYNLIYALLALPMGILADRIGNKIILCIGFILFSITYLGMAFNDNNIIYFVLFFFYGAFSAAYEGVSKAWITNIVPTTDTATAIGTYTSFQSIIALFASSIAGLIWFYWGASIVFVMSGVGVCIVACLLWFTKNESNR